MFKVSDIHTGLVKKQINGLHVVKITDGTMATTFGGYLYRYLVKNPNVAGGTMYQKVPTDDFGNEKIFIKKTMKPELDVSGAELIKTLPDPDDVRVWWVDSPVYKKKILTENDLGVQKIVKSIVGGRHIVGTWQEFADAVNNSTSVPSDDRESMIIEIDRYDIDAAAVPKVKGIPTPETASVTELPGTAIVEPDAWTPDELAYIKGNYTGKKSLADVADHLGVTIGSLRGAIRDNNIRPVK